MTWSVRYVRRLKLDQRLLIRGRAVLDRLLRRLRRDELLDLLLLRLQLVLRFVELLLPLLEEPLEPRLRSATVLRLVQRALEVDDRDAGRLRVELRGGRREEQRGDERHGMAGELHRGFKTPAGLEEVADGELEVDLLLEEVRVAREGDAPLEAQRPEGRDPADAEAPARADVEGVERAGIVRAQASLRGGRVAERRVEVPGVAAVGEDDTADADLLDDRELDLRAGRAGSAGSRAR